MPVSIATEATSNVGNEAKFRNSSPGISNIRVGRISPTLQTATDRDKFTYYTATL